MAQQRHFRISKILRGHVMKDAKKSDLGTAEELNVCRKVAFVQFIKVGI